MTSFAPAERPPRTEYADHYAGYVTAVPDGDILVTLDREGQHALAFLRAVPHQRVDHAYAPGKWTVREVVAHVSDAERVFAYRALRFGRGDRTPLPGFDQDAWVPGSRAGARRWEDLLDEFRVVRAATLHLFRSFASEAWLTLGVREPEPGQRARPGLDRRGARAPPPPHPRRALRAGRAAELSRRGAPGVRAGSGRALRACARRARR